VEPEEPEQERRRRMTRLAWRWLGRFALAAAVATVVLSLGVGVLGRALHTAWAPWVPGAIASVAVIVTGGLLLPALQREIGEFRPPGGSVARRQRRGGRR